MKLNIALMAFMTASLQLAATMSNGQDVSEITVTIRMTNGTLQELINQIQQQTQLSFGYTPDQAKEISGITFTGEKLTVKQVLDQTFANSRLAYRQRKSVIAIYYKDRVPLEQAAVDDPNETAEFATIRVGGTVTDSKTGEKLPGVSVVIKGTTNGTTTDVEGKWALEVDSDASVLVFSSIGFKTIETPVGNRSTVDIQLEVDVNQLNEVVVYSTGYDNVSAERTTGSFSQIDEKLMERNVGSDVLSRLNGVTPSLLIDQRNGRNTFMNIRGISTILANDQPLIVVDNFPYNGDLSTINPNNIESITVLRDAASASIWGVRAGNGVIVITTKKGKRNFPLQVSVNSNVTIGGKSDLFYNPQMTTSELIGVERDLFGRGYYNGRIDNIYEMPVISPVIDILRRVRDGEVTEEQGDAQIAALEGNDVRRDLEKYYYQQSVNQQYAISLSGGADKHAYFFSVGYDNNKSTLAGDRDSRVVLNFQDNFQITDRLALDARVEYTATGRKLRNNLSLFESDLYQYGRLTDDNGNPTTVPYKFRNEFTDQTREQGFLDWTFNPIEDMRKHNTNFQMRNIRSATGFNYNIGWGLTADVRYQYESQSGVSSTLSDKDSYYVRDLVNRFSVFDGTSVNARNVPEGAILSRSTNDLMAHNARAQLNFQKDFENNSVTALAGFEVRQTRTEGFSNYLYGYNPDLGSSLPVDYTTQFATYPGFGSGFIPNQLGNTATLDRYRSYYANAAYTLRTKYTLSASGRFDQSNLFGVKSNQRSTPLWSVGTKWDILAEKFFEWKSLTMLKLRSTYGYNGNIAQSVTALTTAQFTMAEFSQRNAAVIISPPNDNLTWERVRMLNLALDFGFWNDRVNGKIEYYQKRGLDLIGRGPIDPTQGLLTFTGNIASMKGNGWDFEVNSVNIDRLIRWTSNLSFSYTTNEVTDYALVGTVGQLFADNSFSRASDSYSPIKGRPLFGVYSLPWAGLNPETGAPQGYLNGIPSTNYNAIMAGYTLDSLKYHGRALPPAFGFLRNTLEYKGWSLSVNIGYRFGYYFRKKSINYSLLYESGRGHSDYALRWQQPGDEADTNVPSAIFPADGNRDLFYANSEVLVDKGDNIRIQDIRFSYSFPYSRLQKIGLTKIELYGFVNNVGLIWKATDGSIDPDFPSVRPQRTFSLGMRVVF